MLLWTQIPIQTAGQTAARNSQEKPVTPYTCTVNPGDTEVEQGSGLLITARFADRLPGKSTLLVTDPEGNQKRVPMTRSLDDPLFGGHLDTISQNLTYQIEFAGETTKPFQVHVFQYPTLTRADASLTFPSYTGMDSKLVEDTHSVSAVEGSQLEWICHLNKTIAKAYLETKAGDILPMKPHPDNPQQYHASITLTQSQRWKLHLEDQQGRTNQLPPELVAHVTRNQPPKLKLASAKDSRVSPLEEMTVEANVWDDYGLAKYGITYRFGGDQAAELVLGKSVPGNERRKVPHLIDFESLKAQPDQLLSYHFWAEDVGPDGQPRRTSSDMFFAEVRHFEEIFRQGQQPPGGSPSSEEQQQQENGQNGQDATKLAELQKQIINATWKVIRREQAQATPDKLVDDAQLLLESQQTAMEQTRELQEKLEDPESTQHVEQTLQHMEKAAEQLTRAANDQSIDAIDQALASEQAAYQALLKLRAREFEVTRSQQSQQASSSSSSSSSSRAQQQLDQLELKEEDNRYETERTESTTQDPQQQEMRQVLNRLKELASRQADVNKELEELQSALEAAEDKKQEEEILQQIKRLRDEEQRILRDADELQNRMQQPENMERMNDAQQRLQETREQVRQTSEALEKGELAEASASGTRAQRELENLRDDVRRETAGQFQQEMKEIKQTSQKLNDRQQELAKQLQELDQTKNRSLRDTAERENVKEGLAEQKDRLENLLNRMQQTVEAAETSEPLLSKQLYDSVRKTRHNRTEDALEMTQRLLDNGLVRDAQQPESAARKSIEQLNKDVQQAAENVLGDPTESLKQARLFLSASVAKVMERGLSLLGIPCPKRM